MIEKLELDGDKPYPDITMNNDFLMAKKINEVIDNLNNCYAKVRDMPPKSSLEVGSECQVCHGTKKNLWDEPCSCGKVAQNEDTPQLRDRAILIEALRLEREKSKFLEEKLARAEEALKKIRKGVLFEIGITPIKTIVNIEHKLKELCNIATNYFEKGDGK
jgi:hypothetical protein